MTQNVRHRNILLTWPPCPVSGHSGAADGGDGGASDAPSTGESSGLDGSVDGGGELHCAGTPSYTSCPLYATSCPPGCYLSFGGSCQGSPHPCSDNTTAASCAAQAGCTWSDATPVCTGAPTAYCSFSLPYDTCLANGCQYRTTDPSCFGTPTPCNQLSVSACTSQSGCALSAH